MDYITPRTFRAINRRLTSIGFEPVDLWAGGATPIVEYKKNGELVSVRRVYSNQNGKFALEAETLNREDQTYLRKHLRLKHHRD